MHPSAKGRKYLLAFALSAAIFGTIIYASNYFESQRMAELRAIEDQISIDTLSLDTQFSLLEHAPCEDTVQGTELSHELNDLGSRLSYTESRLGSTDPEVVRLKQQYTLLEIRDYLITKQLAAACGAKPVTVLYFYSNSGDCADCDKAGYALSYLHDNYPGLKVYSFDYHLAIGALTTLITLDKVKDDLPAFIIDGAPHYGFTSLADLEAAFPKGTLSALATSTATATTNTKK
ncbi:MAG: hypothetical protein KGI41_01460 [Patescibacteria group bacterium]|nr:hypothetical protein [Patescibacteria group bacterium]MDE1965895.1 hypothetical protein [Patescibacteria group bacterium]